MVKEQPTEKHNKLIKDQDRWADVAAELEAEEIKLAFYDDTVINLLGDVTDKNILDYGGGPGMLAAALQKLGANVKEYDISKDIREQAAQRIGAENVYETDQEIPSESFDIIVCNLVLCIVDEEEVKRIIVEIKRTLTKDGVAYIGFCNPKLLDVPETNLDLRPTPEHSYDENHSYMKTKKEGGYQIVENHRPIEWYERVYKEAGLELADTIFTPEYELGGRQIEDFIIFALKKQ